MKRKSKCRRGLDSDSEFPGSFSSVFYLNQFHFLTVITGDTDGIGGGGGESGGGRRGSPKWVGRSVVVVPIQSSFYSKDAISGVCQGGSEEGRSGSPRAGRTIP